MPKIWMLNIAIVLGAAGLLGFSEAKAEDKPPACCTLHLTFDQLIVIDRGLGTSDLSARETNALREEINRQYQAQIPKAPEVKKVEPEKSPTRRP